MLKCDCGKEHPDYVPKSRLSQVVEKRKEAEAAQAAAEARAADLEAASADVEELRSQLGSLTAERDKLNARAHIMQAGIVDPEGIEVVEALWAAKPEDARPPEGLAGWLTSPDDLPRAVRAYLPEGAPPSPPPAPPAGDPPPEGKPPPAARPPAGSNGTHTAPPPTAAKKTPAEIRAMSPDAYRQWRDQGGVEQHKGA